MPRRAPALPPLLDANAFAAACARALAAEATTSVLMVDLDDLVAVNEGGGHELGDLAIGATARVLADTATSEGWIAARIGGDQFALLAQGVPLERAFLRAERLREELNGAIAARLPADLTCTASIGVAGAPRDAKQPDDLIRRSELALYAAKEQGGNVVALAPSDDMVLRSSYYDAGQLARLRALAERLKRKESVLLREALDDLLRKHDR